jgi:hypothetical protein
MYCPPESSGTLGAATTCDLAVHRRRVDSYVVWVQTYIPPELEDLLAASSAAEPFKSDVISYLQTGRAERIEIAGHAPRVKVTRLLKQLLSSHPELDIEQVRVHGASGCSDFSGTVELATKDQRKTIEFVWCCRWRAEEEGWVDYFGFPDQIRAAREFDWRCFRVWRPSDLSS